MCVLFGTLLNFLSAYLKYCVFRDRARYEFTHEILAAEQSYFHGTLVPRDRRISVLYRNEDF